METKSEMPEVIRFASIIGQKIKQNLMTDADGNKTYINDAQIITLFSRYLGVRYEVITSVNGIGVRLSDGNWTGVLGMIHRSESDLGMSGVIMNEERYEHFDFSHVHFQSSVSFMAEKPVPVSEKFAMVRPFSFAVWAFLLLSVMAVSFLLYMLKRRKVAFHRVILSTLGNVVELPIQFKTESLKLRLFASVWLLAMVVIINSYKGLLLSFMSFPPMVGIRDFSDLSKAASDYSFECFTLKGSYLIKSFLDSKYDSQRAIGECLQRNDAHFSITTDPFLYAATTKKAFIGSRGFLNPYKRDFLVSEDSYDTVLCGIPLSKTFCCLRELNKFIRRCLETGVFLKIFNEYEFTMQLMAPSHKPSRLNVPRKIHLENISGAFLLLISGWLLAFVALLAEIIFKKYVA